MKIKRILKVFKKDWLRVFKNKFAIFLMVALMIMPSLYAWFNIKALWDPFGNTSALPVAVYSEDKTVELHGKKINLGDKIMTSLSHNDKLGWKFVSSKKQLREGVKSGKYYAGICIDENFSKDLTGFLDGKIKRPVIEYRVNTKINAIAPRITDSAAKQIKEEVMKEFTITTSATLVKTFNDLGYKIEENLPMINKAKSMILNANSQLATIDGYAQKIVSLNDQMPTIESKINDAVSLLAYLPLVDDAANKLLTIQQNMPTIKQKLSIVLTLEQNIPNIQAAANKINQLDQNMGNISTTLSNAIKTANDALTVLNQVQQALPQLKQLIKDGGNFATQAKDIATKLQGSVDTIANSVGTILSSISNVGQQIINVADQLDAVVDSPKAAATINSVVAQLNAKLKNTSVSINNLIDLLKGITASKPNPTINAAISTLTTIKGVIDGITPSLDGFDANKLDKTQLHGIIQKIRDVGVQIKSLGSAIDVEGVKKDIKDLLGSMVKTSDDVIALIKKAEGIDFDKLLKSTKQTVNDALGTMKYYQQQLPNIQAEIHKANTMIQQNLPGVISAISKGANFYRNQLPTIEAKLNNIASFVKNKWPQIESELVLTASTIQQKLPEVKQGLGKASDFIKNDWPTIKDGISKLSGVINNLDKNVDLGKLIAALKGDVKKESDFFADPVSLKEHKVYPVANNGSASTPFYTALALWVGAVLISSVTKADYEKDEDDEDYTDREMYLGRWLTYVVIGLIQALIVSLGNYYLLNVDVKEFGYSLSFAALISVCFTTLVYMLATSLGTVGKGVAIIILILSVAGGGGNYPIQVSGAFFNFINPLLPFTYSCDLLREAIGGIYWPNAVHYMQIIVMFFIAGLVIGTLIYPWVKNIRAYVEEEYESSKIFK